MNIKNVKIVAGVVGFVAAVITIAAFVSGKGTYMDMAGWLADTGRSLHLHSDNRASLIADGKGGLRGESAVPVDQKREFVYLDFSGPSVQAKGVSEFRGGLSRLENRYDDSNHLYLFRGFSYSFDFTVSSLPHNAVLIVKHLSSAANGQPGITPVRLIVNGKTAASWRQLETGFTVSEYDITGYLVSGKNTVSFLYDASDGTTGYWQKFVKIEGF